MAVLYELLTGARPQQTSGSLRAESLAPDAPAPDASAGQAAQHQPLAGGRLA